MTEENANQKEASTETTDAPYSLEMPSALLATPARLTLLYESRDKKMCLFEDERGHLHAVPSARLA